MSICSDFFFSEFVIQIPVTVAILIPSSDLSDLVQCSSHRRCNSLLRTCMILPTFYLSFLGLLSNVVNVPKTDSMSTLLLTVTSISFQGPGFPEDTGNL